MNHLYFPESNVKGIVERETLDKDISSKTGFKQEFCAVLSNGKIFADITADIHRTTPFTVS